MDESAALEKAFISDFLPGASSVGLETDTLHGYIEHVAARRLAACGLGPAAGISALPWLDEVFFPSAANANAAATQSHTEFADDDL